MVTSFAGVFPMDEPRYVMVMMLDRQLQRRFAWRIAAADHHGYPGGLFDHSVRAAEIAHALAS